jgi:hypothetical protein
MPDRIGDLVADGAGLALHRVVTAADTSALERTIAIFVMTPPL